MDSANQVRKATLLNKLPTYGLTIDAGSVVAPWIDHTRVPYPYRMTLVVTRQCNSRCTMCNIWQQRDLPELSLDEIRRIFDENDFWFLRSITITGGEATMRRDLPELFDIVAQRCPNLEHIYLATSALNTKRTRDYVEAMLQSAQVHLPKLKDFQVQISVDGVGEMHDRVRGIGGFFDILNTTIDGLERLQERYPVLTLRTATVVLAENVGHVPAIQKWAAERELGTVFSPVIISGTYYENSQGEEVLLTHEGAATSPIQLFEELATTETSSLKFHYRNITEMFQGSERTRPCMMGFYDFVLEYNADVYACVNCETYRFGNLLEQSFDEAWFGPEATVARQQLRTHCCPTCPSPCHAPAVSAAELLQLKWQAIVRRLSRSGANSTQR